jgi:hypothetical protein
MKKVFNTIELTGWCLFSLLITSFLLILGAEPTFNDEPTIKHSDIIALVWVGLLFFSVLQETN